MRAKIALFTILILGISCISLTGCGANEVSATSTTNTSAMASNYGLASNNPDYYRIVERGSKEFFGNHAIDDSFINWFIASYGTDAINTIITRGEYDNPDIWYELIGKSIHVLWYEYCLYSGINAYDNSYTYLVNTMTDDEVIFDIAGDVSLADEKATTNFMMDQKNGLMDCFDEGMFEAINDSDIFIVNNEFAYTDGGDAIVEKYYTFRGKAELIEELQHIGVGLVTIANNHVYDYREEGFLDTLRNLEKYNMPYIGAGRNLEDAKRCVYYIANGRKIAVVNASQIEKEQNFTKAATEDEPGILKCLNPEEFIDEIVKAKKNADYVLAIVHWGTEYQARFGNDQKRLAEQFAEAGADVIIGGHPHVLQGFDYIGDAPVYYSLGNFYFSLDEDMPLDYDTGMARIVIDNDGGIKASFVPCRFSDGIISLTDESEDISSLFSELNGVSGNAVLDKNGTIIKI